MANKLTMSSAVDSFLLNCHVKNLSPRCIRWYALILRIFTTYVANEFPDVSPDQITPEHLRQYIRYLQAERPRYDRVAGNIGRGLATNTINGHIRTLRVFFGFLAVEGKIPHNSMESVKQQKGEKKVIQTFSDEQVVALLAQPDRKSFVGFRNHTIMYTLLDTGMRLSELTGIPLENVLLKDGLILVMGKGRKERYVPMGNVLKKVLWRYLERRREISDFGNLFFTEDGAPLACRTIEQTLMRYGKEAKISGVRVSPHTFRHTFAKNYILNGGDIFSLQQILGHTTMDMVRNYVNLAGRDVKQQHQKFSPGDRFVKGARL